MTNPFQNHQQELQNLIDEYGITYLAIFGSRARGDNKPDSDYDLLVETEKVLGFKFFEIESKLEEILNTKVDLVEKNSLSKYIRPYVVDDIQVLYEKAS